MKKQIYIAVNYPLFTSLYKEASGYDDVDMFVAERGWQEWMNEFELNEVIAILKTAFSLSKLGFCDIRNRLSMTVSEFSRQYKIPLRTIEDWNAGRRSPNEHVLSLIAYTVFILELSNGNDK